MDEPSLCVTNLELARIPAGIILLVAPAVAYTTMFDNPKWLVVLVYACVCIVVVLPLLSLVTRSICFAEKVNIRTLTREFVFGWNDVQYVLLEDEDGGFLKFAIGLAWKRSRMTVGLKNGKRYRAVVSQRRVAEIESVVYPRLDPGWKQASDEAHRKERTNRISIHLILSVVFGIVAIPFLAYSANLIVEIYNGTESVNWPIVDARVEESTVEQAPRRHTLGERIEYKVHLRYSYAVGSKNYTGDRLEFMEVPIFNDDPDINRLKGLSPGSPLHIYVNPSFPNSSVFRPGMTLDRCLPRLYIVVIALVLCVVSAKSFQDVLRILKSSR
ncbi:MAG: DUF3592 domain-containing protein [Pirellulales bacterium]